jgi:hypothetical protein
VRAREISLFVICVAIAAPLIGMSEVFMGTPDGTDISAVTSVFTVSTVIGILAGGGVSILGFSFKVPAVLSAFLGIYIFSTALLDTLVLQMIQPWEVGATFAGVFAALFAVVGYYAALEIAGGAHGPMM